LQKKTPNTIYTYGTKGKVILKGPVFVVC